MTLLATVVLLRFGVLTLQHEGAPTDVVSLFKLGLGKANFDTTVNFLPYGPVRDFPPCAIDCIVTFFREMESPYTLKSSSPIFGNSFSHLCT